MSGFVAQAQDRIALRQIELLAAGGDSATPIVIALHGLGDTPDAFGAFIAPLVPGTRLLALQAPIARQERGYSWYRIGTPYASKDITSAAHAVGSTLRALRKQYPAAGKPILIGYSQGAVISLRVATLFPDMLRCVVGIAGYIDSSRTMRQSPAKTRPDILIVHGQKDTVVPYRHGTEARRIMSRAGYSTQLITHPKGHRIPSATLQYIQYWLHDRLR